MKTEVANIRAMEPGWTTHPSFAYIGRRRMIEGLSFDGYFGNPHPVGFPCPTCNIVHHQGMAVGKYQEYFEERIASDERFRRNILSLRGKTLVCFCVSQICHGNIIANWLNSQEGEIDGA